MILTEELRVGFSQNVFSRRGGSRVTTKKNSGRGESRVLTKSLSQKRCFFTDEFE